MKRDLGLRYKKVKRVTADSNPIESVRSREEACLVLLRQLKERRLIVNIDETLLSESNFTRKVWTNQEAGTTTFPPKWSKTLKVIAAIDTEGRLLYSVSIDNTNQFVYCLFLV